MEMDQTIRVSTAILTAAQLEAVLPKTKKNPSTQPIFGTRLIPFKIKELTDPILATIGTSARHVYQSNFLQHFHNWRFIKHIHLHTEVNHTRFVFKVGTVPLVTRWTRPGQPIRWPAIPDHHLINSDQARTKETMPSMTQERSRWMFYWSHADMSCFVLLSNGGKAPSVV